MSWLLAVASLVGQMPALPSPQGELRTALADLEARVPAEAWPTTRYLSAYALPPAEWPAAAAVASFVLNSVSRSELLVRPEVVPGTGGRLLRISLADYELPPELWERLASRDPYWHQRTRVVAPGAASLKQTVLAEAAEADERTATAEPLTVYTDGGWLDLAAAARLRNLTTSGGALLRVDEFLARAATTLDGGLYYELAGVPEREADFFSLLGVDPATVERLLAEQGANLIYSQVTRKLRRVVRRQGPLGGVWTTFDVARSTADRDPFRRPGPFDYDAGEHIAAKANGLHLYALYDARGVRQDTVPDAIAKDHRDALGPGIVVPLLSCVRCHVEDGLRPVVNDQARLLGGGRVALWADDPREARRLAAFYGRPLEKPLTRDRTDFAEALAAATGGLASADLALLLDRLLSGYLYRLVGPGDAARELGLDRAALTERLWASHDPVLLGLAEGLSVQREQWIDAFAEAAVLAAPAPPLNPIPEEQP